MTCHIATTSNGPSRRSAPAASSVWCAVTPTSRSRNAQARASISITDTS